MKYGHVEGHLAGANPRTWRDAVMDSWTSSHDVYVFVGGGVALVICMAVLYFVSRWRDRR